MITRAASNIQQNSSRASKSRTGCEQCKRRKVKCDEKQPTCSKCASRGETCTGNFQKDSWQVERPWAWISEAEGTAPLTALENEALRHWYDKACLNMAMFYPPVNPLSYTLAVLLRRSNALRHTIQSVAAAHREHFEAARLSSALNERTLAIVSLQSEVARLRSPCSKRPTLLRTMILSSLILCISSGWLDPSGTDFGAEFLLGVKGAIQQLADLDPTDTISFYILGLFLYWDAFSSFLFPSDRHSPPSSSALRAVERPPFNCAVHPVTGIATTLFPVITEVGQYYRRVVDTRERNPCHELELISKLREWQSPDGSPHQAQLLELASRYRDIGMIMLYQAAAVVGEISPSESISLLERVLAVTETLKHMPKDNPLLNWVGPLLLIAGSELPQTLLDARDVVRTMAARLISWTRVPTYSRAFELIQEVWRLRDSDTRISWLELMVQQGLALAAG